MTTTIAPHPGPLSALLGGEPSGFEFFQALRLLEEAFPGCLSAQPRGQRGKADPSVAEPALVRSGGLPRDDSRIDISHVVVRPHDGLGFPSADLRGVEHLDEERLRLVVTFLGLYGVDSPLPSYFTTAGGTTDGEASALREFLDIFNTRLYALFYAAMRKYRPAFGAASDVSACLAGLGAPAPDGAVSLSSLVPFASVLRAPVRNAQGLVRLVADRFPGVPVSVVENVPRWITLESRPRLGGKGSAVLGSNALIGGRLLDVSGRFRIVIGPVGWTQFESLRPGGSDARSLAETVRLYAPDFLDYEVELRIKSTDLPDTRLGRNSNRMGRTTWVGVPKEAIVSEIVSYA